MYVIEREVYLGYEETRYDVRNKYTNEEYNNVRTIIESGNALLLVWSDLKNSVRVYKNEVEIKENIMRF